MWASQAFILDKGYYVPGAPYVVLGRYQQGQAVSQLRIFGQRRVQLSWVPRSTGWGPGTVGIWAPGHPLTQAVIEWALFWLARVVASAAMFSPQRCSCCGYIGQEDDDVKSEIRTL